jgi:hypothetical protein
MVSYPLSSTHTPGSQAQVAGLGVALSLCFSFLSYLREMSLRGTYTYYWGPTHRHVCGRSPGTNCQQLSTQNDYR